MEAQHIEHTLEPIFDERSHVLVLGDHALTQVP